MAAVTTANPVDFSNRVQIYFNPKFLEALDYNLVLSQYGMKKAYPVNGTTIRFFRPRAANTTGVAAISEGTTPTTLTEVAVGHVDIALAQRGALATVTDLTRAEDLIDTVQLYTKTMGADAALDLDTVVRNALRTGLNNSVQVTFAGSGAYGGFYFERFAGTTTGTGAGDDTSAECHATFHALSASNAKFTRARHLTNITTLKAARVPTIGGRYVAITPNEVLHDIRQDTDWVSAATQVNNNALYKHGEIMLDGAVFVPSDNPWREGATYGTYSATGANFSVFYLGADAFGIPEHTNKIAGGSQMGPKTIILSGADKADPLALKTFIGWKAFWGVAPFITNVAGEVPHYLQFRCKSTFA